VIPALTIDYLLVLVPASPLGAFLVLGLAPIYLPRRMVLAVGLAGGVVPMLVMAGLTARCLSDHCHAVLPIFTLMASDAPVALALLLDPLSTVVGMTVTLIGACVIVYSADYMPRGRTSDLRRFFALMNLFLASMLAMVLAGDSIIYFLGWEMMGMCSFFLIAYNIVSRHAIAAGRKAFIISRLADVMLLAALLLLFIAAGSVRIEALIPAGLAMPVHERTIVAALLLGGALGKSAQLPFHTWLPSAMTGPTPVSALLHSATMVAAGAYLMARFAPLLSASPSVMTAMAVGGAATAAFGAFIALFQSDVKRLLAYSSISQIGFMMLAIGVGAPAAAIAHFVMHALFKSLLFLAAGDLARSMGGDTSIAAMRGAKERRPLAFAAFAAGAASLAGLPLVTAGWWSKEAILGAAFGAGTLGRVLWATALLSAVLTASYAFRTVITALQPSDRRPTPAHTGLATALALTLLTLGSLAGGLLVGPIIHLLGGAHPATPAFSVLLAAAAPMLGLAIAAKIVRTPDLAARLATSRALRQGLRIDTVYHILFVRPFQRLVRSLGGAGGGIADPVGTAPVFATLWLKRQTIDRFTVDVFNRGWMMLAEGAPPLWAAARQIQTGRVRDSVMALAGGAAALLALAWVSAWR
jgi:NADH-quinone oxidoreductase subunit L